MRPVDAQPRPRFRAAGSRAFTSALVLALASTGCDLDLGNLPTSANAELQARLVAARYLTGRYDDVIDGTLDNAYPIYQWSYTQGVALWGMLLLDEALPNPTFSAQVRAALESYDDHGRIKIHGGSEPIDYIGALAHAILEYSARTDDTRFLDGALEAARFFHEDVARTPEGLIAYHSDPERGRIWIDALFMVAPLLAKTGTLLDDETYYDDVLFQFHGFAEKLRDPTTGLYHQGWNWHGAGASPGLWGRGNGRLALALTEVLATIPPDYPGYDELLVMYQDLAAALAAQQGPGGMWHQLLDRHDSYEETSCTAMFIYALSSGLRHGWLEDEYHTVVTRAHEGLSRMISLSGDLDNICPGTPTQSSESAYLNRGPRRNDDHGVGPVMLALYGILTLEETEE